MGAWEAGSFQNDTALDWVGDLCESGDVATVHTALKKALEQRTPPQPSFLGKLLFGKRPVAPYLEADAASEAIAAAEIVAFWMGNPCPHFPDNLVTWARERSGAVKPELVSLALQAIVAIRTKSELKELWTHKDGSIDPDWEFELTDLEERLNGKSNVREDENSII